jgi:hypothetical protein
MRLGEAKPHLRHLDENDACLIALARARHLQAFLRKVAVLIGPVRAGKAPVPEQPSRNAQGRAAFRAQVPHPSVPARVLACDGRVFKL